MKRGIATFTLDTGKCPKWLFERMVKLGREMGRVLIVDSHSGIASQSFNNQTLNLTAKDGQKNRDISVELMNANAITIQKDIQILRKHSSKLSQMVSFQDNGDQMTLLNLERTEFKTHPVIAENFWHSKYLERMLLKLVSDKPGSYENLLATKGVGSKTVRALSLVSEVIYGAPASYMDPARYSFAHGGKDATPYPVDRPTYDRTIEILSRAVRKTSLNPADKTKALQRLNGLAIV